MSRHGKRRTLFFVCGIALLAVSVLIRFTGSGEKIDDPVGIGRELDRMLPVRVPGVVEERGDYGMPVLAVDGHDYAALLEIGGDALFPVLSLWDPELISSCPCRFSGDPYSGTLVIGGGRELYDVLSAIDVGDTVTVTDMHGTVYRYGVTKIRHAGNALSGTITSVPSQLTLFVPAAQLSGYLIVHCDL